MYYNQITEQYHFNERKAEDLLEELSFFYKEINHLKSENNCLEKVLTPKIIKEIDLSVIIKSLRNKNSKGFYAIEKKDYDNLISFSTILINIYVDLFVNESFEKYDIEKTEKNELTIKDFLREIYSILGFFNSALHVGIYPKYIKDFI